MFDFQQYLRAPDFLPWLAYDDETRLFLLDNNYIGFSFSMLPMSGFEASMEKRFKTLLNYEFPKGTFLQFNLMVLDDVSDHLFDMHEARSVSRDPLISAATSNTIDFLRKGANGQVPGVAVRNSLLIVSVKIPIGHIDPSEEEAADAVRFSRETAEILTQVGFHELRQLNDTEMLYQLSQLLNRGQQAAWRSGRQPVDENKFIREQVLDFDTTISVKETAVKIGPSWISSLSVKKLPRHSYFGLAERLSIDPESGDRGIPCTHMVSCTVKIEDITDMKPNIERKRQYYGNYASGPFARLLPEYKLRHSDYAELSEKVGEGELVHRFALNILLFGPSEEEARRHATTARTYLNELGFSFMEDAGIVFNLVRANLPLGPEKEDQRNLSRYRTMSSGALATFIPIFYEWRGTDTPLLSLIGRGGQIMGFSPFDSGTNYNFTVSAESGAGKSFLSNELISAILATGGKVWVIDVGRSYMKLNESLDGQFLCFDQQSNICLNPFSSVKTDAEFEEVQDIILHLLATMAAPREGMSDFQTGMLRTIIGEQFKIHRENLSIDHIMEACFVVSKDQGEGLEKEFSEKRISDIGHGLKAFSSTGQYGKYFNGPANIDFKSNFVLLELEELKSQKHLQTVVLLLLIYQIQNGMYLGDISTKKMMLVDEAWDLLSDPMIAGFMEAGYRRFRKYNGSAGIITQALTDLHDSSTGQAVLANSAATIMLQQKSQTLDKLASGDHPEFSRALCDRLKTVRTVPGRYSEVFVRTGQGMGIGRFMVDPFRALLYSTRPDDVSAIKRHTDQGKSNIEAIRAVLEARSSGGMLP